METLRFLYTFQLPNGTEKIFEVLLDAASLGLVLTEEPPKPDWTKLKFHQCANCPLGDDVEYCPVAVNLSTLIETFKDHISFETLSVSVRTTERTYQQNTSLQKALSSVIGIYMVTSNCPIMDKLRPNVRFHLPFASLTESVYRTVSMYLTAQYFLMQQGEEPDWELKNLMDTFNQVAIVNKGMSSRVSHASSKDANANAVVILSSQGDMVNYSIENQLDELKSFFTTYFKNE